MTDTEMGAKETGLQAVARGIAGPENVFAVGISSCQNFSKNT